jgi:CRISPR-associated protein Csb3
MSITHRFNIDPTNPGQFLACCGLLELADCLDPESVARFDKNQFLLETKMENLVEQFLDASAEPPPEPESIASDDAEDTDESEEKSPPLVLAGNFCLRLDWWTDSTAIRAGFKTWAGGQTVQGFFNGMRAHIRTHDLLGENLLTTAVALSKPKPFYFDCRLSSLTTLTMGFSAENFLATYSPAVEALTLVGLQRFRPKTIDPREKYAYDTWAEPLPVSIAAAVAHGLLPALSSRHYQFPLVVRTGGKYKAFGPAR